MSDHKIDGSETTRASWWARRRNYFFLAVLGLGTSEWALKQLGWLFGWTSEPNQGHLGQIFDATVILAAGIFVVIHAFRHIHRNDAARKAKLDGFHDKALKAKQAKHLHA